MGVTHDQERECSVYQLTNTEIYHSGDFMTSRAKDLFIHQEGDRSSELEVSLSEWLHVCTCQQGFPYKKMKTCTKPPDFLSQNLAFPGWVFS